MSQDSHIDTLDVLEVKDESEKCQTPTKKCTGCGLEKPIDTGYYNSIRRGKPSKYSECKECSNERGRKYRENSDYLENTKKCRIAKWEEAVRENKRWRCKECKKLKKASSFYRSAHVYCRDCNNSKGTEWRNNNKPKWRKIASAAQIRYQAKRRKERAEAFEIWKQENPEKWLEMQRQKALKDADREWKRKNRAKLLWATITPEQYKRWRELHRGWSHITHNRIWQSVKSSINRHTRPYPYSISKKDLGLDPEGFRDYIESLWDDDMDWTQYGPASQNGWVLSFKRKLRFFDWSDPEEYKKAVHHTNIQPVWWSDIDHSH